MNPTTCSNSCMAANNWNNYTNQNVRQIVEGVFYGGLGTVEGLVGIVTNIINCLVFWRQGLGDRINLCLFSLAVVDGLYFTIMCLIYTLPWFIRFHDVDHYEEYETKVIILTGVLRGFALTSSCINMAVAVDTCVCVVCPHRAASLMRTKTMASLIVSCFLIIQVSYIVYPFAYTPTQVTRERVHWLVVPTKFHEENKLFVYVFQNLMLETVLPLVNLTVVSVTTVVTVKTLRSAMAWRVNTANGCNNLRTREVALIKMLTIIAFVFVVVMSPMVACQVSLWFIPQLFDDAAVLDKFTSVAVVMFAFCHIYGCLNFFIYCYRSSRFRRELRRIFSNTSLSNSAASGSRALPKARVVFIV